MVEPRREDSGKRRVPSGRGSARVSAADVSEDDQDWFYSAARAGVPLSGARAAPLYRLAFTHRSAAPPGDSGACNERLEFLGDSIISAALTTYLYKRFPGEKEGFLSDMRAKLVMGRTLAELANKTGLVEGLRRSESSTRCSSGFDPAHEDLFEAVAGAVSLDAGFDAAADWVTSCVERHIDVSELVAGAVSNRAALQREARSLGVRGLEVQVSGQAGGLFKAVVRSDAGVAGVGEGNSSKKAAETACEAARAYLGLVRQH